MTMKLRALRMSAPVAAQVSPSRTSGDMSQFAFEQRGGRCKLLLEGAPFRVCSADEVRSWEENRIAKVQRALEAKERRLAADVAGSWGGEKAGSAHSDLQLAAEVRQCPLGSGAGEEAAEVAAEEDPVPAIQTEDRLVWGGYTQEPQERQQ
eukprot:s74_g5.t1